MLCKQIIDHLIDPFVMDVTLFHMGAEDVVADGRAVCESH